MDVEIDRRLAERVGKDMDDVLATMPLVDDDPELTERLSAQLVDLLVESLFLDLRRRFSADELTRAEFTAEVTRLAAQCRQAGLLPLRSRR